jgi:signal transduction histidine kinase
LPSTNSDPDPSAATIGAARRSRPPLLTPARAIALTGALTAGFAIVDFTSPGEVDGAILYVLCVLASGWSRSRAFLWLTTAICTLLAIADFILGPQPPESLHWAMAANRSFVVIGVLVMAATLEQRMRMLDRIEAARDWQARQNEILEQRVEQEVARRLAVEQNLYQAQKMEAIGQLTGGIAHDFNNVLTAVIGNLDRLECRLEPGDPCRRLAEDALRGAEQGAQLTRRLLGFARRQHLEPEITEIDRVLAETLALAAQVVSDRIELAPAPDPDLWRCSVDRAELQSALLNLVLNARDAMPGGGRIIIAAANVSVQEETPDLAAADYVRISVVDTGSGMTPEVQARALEPFFTTKPAGQGTGLGLSMVYGFARQSGGALRIDSAPGRGTTLDLYLPRATMRSQRKSSDSSSANPKSAAIPCQTRTGERS